MSQRICTVDGCEKPTRSNKADWCKMHYHRWYRHGSVDKVATATDVSVYLGRRYRAISRAGHPLATKHGRVYEHRAVLFDEIGYGPHACHWCGDEVDWLPKGDPRELQPDHLNNDGGDNRLDNLVASCRTCNTARAMQRRSQALKEAGWWSNHDTIARLRSGGRAALVEPIGPGVGRISDENAA